MSKSAKEVVIVTERFHPDTTSATGQYMTELAVGLQERGLDITVVTRKIKGQSDELTAKNIKNAGVTVKRLPLPHIGQSSFLGRGINWLMFIMAVISYLLTYKSKKITEIVFVSYPVILPPFIWLICKIRQWDYTYIIYDFYPDCAVELGYIKRNGIFHKIWDRLNDHILRDAKNVVALGPRMRSHIINTVGEKFSEEKVVIIHNWADGDFIQPKSKEENWFSQKHDLVDKFALIYSGNIGEFHDLETLIRAGTEITTNIKILIIGEGDNKSTITNLAKDLDVLGDSVDILPYQPWKTVPYSLTAGDVSIVAVKPEFEGLCVSSKLYSALATGQPVLIIAREHDDESQIIQKYDAGKQVSPGNPEAIIKAVNQWIHNPEQREEQGNNARKAFENHFTKSQSIDRYYDILSK